MPETFPIYPNPLATLLEDVPVPDGASISELRTWSSFLFGDALVLRGSELNYLISTSLFIREFLL
jgi:hypothetical protein